MTCEVCGQRVRVEGNTTKHYVGVDAEAVRERDEIIAFLESALEDAIELSHACDCHPLKPGEPWHICEIHSRISDVFIKLQEAQNRWHGPWNGL